jgi:thrombospondin type 3 repeat protein
LRRAARRPAFLRGIPRVAQTAGLPSRATAAVCSPVPVARAGILPVWGALTAALLAVALAAMLCVTTATAESSAPGGLQGLLRVRSADTPGRGVVDLGFFSSLYTLSRPNGEEVYFYVEDLQVAFGLSRYLQVGVDLPFRGWSASNPPGQFGLGDLAIGGTLQLPLPGRAVRLGAIGSVYTPTGDESKGMSTGTTDFDVGGALTIDLTNLQSFLPTRVHLNGLYRWNRNETDGFGLGGLDSIQVHGFWPPGYPAVPLGEKESWNDQLLVRAGLEFRTRAVSLFTEFAADVLLHVPDVDFTDNPVFVTQGALVKFRNGLDVKLAADISLQSDQHPPTTPDVPDWRLWLGVTWRTALAMGDRDHDGIPDKRDQCPEQPEDFDGYQDEDGCPDLDNDGDGIPDTRDLAPDLPEDVDGFEDDDGRPDLDNDGDGIPDVRDLCPNEAEDFDGDQDTDGCPDVQPPPQQAP